ncbi:hypothetical protein YPPY03_3382, partial [Yersinia pestis PY-03]
MENSNTIIAPEQGRIPIA